MPILGSSHAAANEDMISKILTRWGYNYLIQEKTLRERKKLLVTSNIFFSLNVFKSCLLLMLQNEYLWIKELISLPSTITLTLSWHIVILTFPRQQILDSSKLKEFADDNFKFDKNSRKLSKRVENTVGKGEIACYEQLLLFSQCFQKACFQGASKGVIVWEWVKCILQNFDM